MMDNTVTITECSDVGVGYLYSRFACSMFIMFYEINSQDLDPKSCFRDYQKYNLSKKLGYQSYTEHIEYMIDTIIDQQEPTTSITDNGVHTVMDDACPGVDHRLCAIPKHLSELSDTIVSDMNDIHKTKGFLAHTSTELTFCGPDREPGDMSTL